MNKKLDLISEDLFNFAGAVYSITDLAKFLRVSYDMARGMIVRANLQPVCGQNTGKRYYYRDIAEMLACGA